ncbi:MAG: ABC transporter permease subunit [Sphaerochaeta sp.]|jgi:NitT/TauT family transport system permease protein|nr:ABC transporter permease subunit [Sphaerochaeta sp.]HHT79834.1 ABC transporter permease subunit [Spirochaetales bacterium]
MNSTSSAKKRGTIRVWSVVLWLGVWQLVATILGQDILLVSPLAVILRLFELVRTSLFWTSIGYSFSRIAGGFFLATLLGVLFSIFSYRYRWFEELLAPPVQTIKATPVASFVILTLVWIAPQNLSVFISFLMVFPIMYTNVLMGIRSTDKKLLEMATVFRVPAYRRIRYIYLSQVLPFFRSACSVALGLSWKAGIAAEVIGLPQGSIGEMLYQAKLYLDTPDMFAWTLVIIVISVWFEKIFLILLDKAMLKMEHL